MTDDKIFGEPTLSNLEAYQLSLAALEAEKARLVTKYDARIKALKKAIQTLQKAEAAKGKVEGGGEPTGEKQPGGEGQPEEQPGRGIKPRATRKKPK